MAAIAARIVDTVHAGHYDALPPLLRVAAAVPLPAGADPTTALVVHLARLALTGPADIDDVAVDRACDGALPGDALNRAELAEAVRRLRVRGWDVRRIGRHLQVGHRRVAGIASHETVPSFPVRRAG